MIDLINDIQRKTNELTSSIRQLKKNGEQLAEAERDYKITLRTEALRLREEGKAVTLIDLIVYGVPEVAKLRFARDVAQTIYDTNKEHINTTKLIIRVLQEQINKEWSNETSD